MSGEESKSMWRILAPKVWASPPAWMSFSTLINLESCPRQWALNHSEYPEIWPNRGYPRPFQQVVVEGVIVHAAIEKITKTITAKGCSSLQDEKAIVVLRELGGFTQIVKACLDETLKSYENNPRISNALEEYRLKMLGRILDLRLRVQQHLVRITSHSSQVFGPNNFQHQDLKSRMPLSNGTHSEVRFRALDMQWQGIVDLISITDDVCEIKDFKTGTPKKEHVFQLQIYALLWTKDKELNPLGRQVNSLVISYDEQDVRVPVMGAKMLETLEAEIRSRSSASVLSLASKPPKAVPSIINCQYCTVRQLCDEYWLWLKKSSIATNEEQLFTDIEVQLIGQHGPSSWDAKLLTTSNIFGKSILLRMKNLEIKLKPNQVVRLLNVRITFPDNEVFDDQPKILVANMSSSSEIYLVT